MLFGLVLILYRHGYVKVLLGTEKKEVRGKYIHAGP